MTADFTLRTTCRLCESPDLVSVLDLGSTPVGDDYVPEDQLSRKQQVYPLELKRCADCGLVQVAGVIAPEIVYRNYIYESSASLGLDNHFLAYARSLVERLCLRCDSLAVDVGSNVGLLLAGLKECGLNVLGVEPATRIAANATAAGIPTLPEFFDPAIALQIREEHGPASVITANNVMANVDDMPRFAEAVRTLLADDGVFVFETGYMLDTVQNLVVDNIYHEHLSYFSILPLERFFDENGLELIDVDRVSTKGGSIRGFVQKKGGPRLKLPTVGALMTLETELGFQRGTPLDIFARRAEQSKAQLLDYLDTTFKGRPIPGYGASVGVTSLIYWLGISDRLECLLDDSKPRHGLYSPGWHIPVRDSMSIYEDAPEGVLLFAWRYATPILKRHQRYLDEGGSFALPLPALEIISGDRS